MAANAIPDQVKPEPPVKTLPDTFDYEGEGTDELGNTAHFKVRVKSDLHSASINGPFTPIEYLGNNTYQWVAGSIAGIQFRLTQDVFTLINSDGGVIGYLHRIHQDNQSSYTQPEIKKEYPPNYKNLTIIDSTMRAPVVTTIEQTTKEGYDIQGKWTGVQDAYNLKNKDGGDMVISGKLVRIPPCRWEFVFRNGEPVTSSQENLVDQKIAFYEGSSLEDVQVSNGVMLFKCTMSTTDKTSKFDITFRFINGNHATCMSPGQINGPNFELYKN